MSKRIKWSIGGVFLAGVVMVLVLTAAKKREKSVEVRIEPVQNRDLVASVTASGQVRPQTKVDIASDVSGKITKLSVKEGQLVTAGQFLLQIDPEQAKAAVQRAEAMLASAKAQLAQSQANLSQAKKSYERSNSIKQTNARLISDEQIDQLKTAVEVNEALVEASRHSVDQATASVNDATTSLGKTTIYAPMAGRVTRLV